MISGGGVGGDKPIGVEPGATVSTGGADVKSSTEVTLSGSFANASATARPFIPAVIRFLMPT